MIIEVKTKRPYNVNIASGLIDNLEDMFNALKVSSNRKIAIITDDIVDKIYAERVAEQLSAKYSVVQVVFEHGENNKTYLTVSHIVDKLISADFGRNDLLVALGGGIVGDVTGFVAGIYMRGIDYIQIPTTLLAAIDSSVGGKTAINHNGIKNIIGVFNQPLGVIIDVDVIQSAPNELFLDGMGEGIKYAVLMGQRLLELVENKSVGNNFEEFINLCVQYKSDVVSCDEREGGLRRLLNLGHTVGHAIEKESNHKISHGRAVVIGILLMQRAMMNLGFVDINVVERMEKLAVDYYGDLSLEYDFCALIEHIKHDKKANNSAINLIYAEDYGLPKQMKISIEELQNGLLKINK